MTPWSPELLRPPLTISAGMQVLMGLPCLLAPALAARLLGAHATADVSLALRLFGAAALVLAALAWLASRHVAVPYLRDAAALLGGYHALAAMVLWGAVVAGALLPWFPGAAAVTHLFLAGWLAAGLMAR